MSQSIQITFYNLHIAPFPSEQLLCMLFGKVDTINLYYAADSKNRKLYNVHANENLHQLQDYESRNLNTLCNTVEKKSLKQYQNCTNIIFNSQLI